MMAVNVIIFDLDHTLLDTSRFKRALFSSLEPYGVSYRHVANAYIKVMNRHGKFKYDYSLNDHLGYLRKEHNFPLEQARKKMHSVLKRTKQFLFPQAKAVLSAFRRKGFQLILISRGNELFNRQKIYNSGLDEYFDKIHVTSKPKHSLLKRYFDKKKNIWVINDNINELLFIKENFPYVHCVLKHRPDHMRNHGKLAKITNLKQLVRLIQ